MLAVTYARMAEDDMARIRRNHPGHASRLAHIITRWSIEKPSDAILLSYPKGAKMVAVELGKLKYSIVFIHRLDPREELRIVAICSLCSHYASSDSDNGDETYFDITPT